MCRLLHKPSIFQNLDTGCFGDTHDKYDQQMKLTSQPISAQCCVSYRNQSKQMIGFYMKRNTGLKWVYRKLQLWTKYLKGPLDFI